MYHAVFRVHIEHLLNVMAIVDEVLIESRYVRTVSWNVNVKTTKMYHGEFVTRIIVYMYMEIFADAIFLPLV